MQLLILQTETGVNDRDARTQMKMLFFMSVSKIRPANLDGPKSEPQESFSIGLVLYGIFDMNWDVEGEEDFGRC